jgi:hypothetical protein
MVWRSRVSLLAKTVAINLQWGLSWAIAFAAVYAVWASVWFAIGGQRAFARKHVTFESTILSYLESALVAGLVLGLLRPLNKYRAGSVLIGFATGAAIGLTVALAMEASVGIDGAPIFVSVVLRLMGRSLHSSGRRLTAPSRPVVRHGKAPVPVASSARQCARCAASTRQLWCRSNGLVWQDNFQRASSNEQAAALWGCNQARCTAAQSPAVQNIRGASRVLWFFRHAPMGGCSLN